MIKQSPIYSDLDLSFIPHPLTGDLAAKTNSDSIKRAVQNLFRINAFDIPFKPSLRSSLKRYMFEGNDHISRSSAVEDMKWIVEKLEPRIKLIDIQIDGDTNPKAWIVTIAYMIKSLSTEERFNFSVERVR